MGSTDRVRPGQSPGTDPGHENGVRLHADVSVVVPTYNRLRMLPGCLESAIAQERLPAEILVVDDGSTDGTDLLVEGVARRRVGVQSIRYLRQPQSGVSSARNRGLLASSHPTVLFLDSDDRWAPSYVASVTRIFEEHPDVAIVFTRYRIVDECGALSEEERREKVARNLFLTGLAPPLEDSRHVHLVDADVVMRHLVYRDFGFITSATAVHFGRLRHRAYFDEALTCAEDTEFLVRILSAARRVAYLDRELVDYVLHGQNTVSVANGDVEQTLRNLRSAVASKMRMLIHCRDARDYRVLLASIALSFRLLGWLLRDLGDRAGALEAFRSCYQFSRSPRDGVRCVAAWLASRGGVD